MSTDVRSTADTTNGDDPLLSPDDVSIMLGGVPVRTLKRWRTERYWPSRCTWTACGLPRSAVEAWLEQKDREAAAWMAS